MESNDSILKTLEYVEPFIQATHANALILAQVKTELTLVNEQQRKLLELLYGEGGTPGLIQRLNDLERSVLATNEDNRNRRAHINGVLMTLLGLGVPLFLGFLGWFGNLAYEGFIHRNLTPMLPSPEPSHSSAPKK